MPGNFALPHDHDPKPTGRSMFFAFANGFFLSSMDGKKSSLWFLGDEHFINIFFILPVNTGALDQINGLHRTILSLLLFLAHCIYFAEFILGARMGEE